MTTGCAPASAVPEASVDRGGPTRSAPPQVEPPPSFGATEAAIGPFLASRQVVPHSFALVNPFAEPLTIDGVEVMSTCCSGVVDAPRAVPAKAPFALRVEYKSGQETIRRGLAFVLNGRRADGEPVAVPLTVIVDMIAACELATIDQSTNSLPGEPVHWAFRLITRRASNAAESPGPALQTGPLVAASFAGPPREEARGDLIESTRRLEVHAIATDQIGHRRDELRLVEADGTLAWTHPLLWQVRPMIAASPEAFFVDHSGESTRTIFLTSARDPFCVTAVDHPMVASIDPPPDGDAKKSHILTVRLNAQAMKGATEDLVIRTNHPRQPEVSVTVMATAAKGGAE